MNRAGRNGTTKIALISFTQRGASRPDHDLADLLLRRAVSRLNRLVRPDLLLFFADTPDFATRERLQLTRSRLDRLEAPYLAIPSRPEVELGVFYDVFDRPAPTVDIGGATLLITSRAKKQDSSLLSAARAGEAGRLITVSPLCPLHREQTGVCSFREAILDMARLGSILSLSGPCQLCAGQSRIGSVAFIAAPSLCEAPYAFSIIDLLRQSIQERRHNLAMPAGLKLMDRHVHTQLAYCSENMTVQGAIEMAKAFGLAGLSFAEHSSALYFSRQRCSDVAFLGGIESAREDESRMQEYLKMKDADGRDTVQFRLEADCDIRGKLLLKDSDRSRFDGISGAIHLLPSMVKGAPASRSDPDDYMRLLSKMLRQNIDVLVHPFRVFRRGNRQVPRELFVPVAELLRKHGTAAELNFHTNEPSLEFARICLDMGVKLSFGSDAHNLWEVGDFAYHLALLEDAGFNGDLSDVLV